MVTSVENPRPIGAQLLRDHEVAAILNVSKTKAYLMMRSGEIPGVLRIGRCIRVHRPTLERWIAEQAAQ